ncbi:MAG: hypothetical protein ACRCVI_02630 [Mycoplasmoidaceae bacterium]
MSTISFFALGGLDEKEKKCFVLGVNHEYFIFNLGISTPIFASLGIKKIVPDYTWIEKHKNQIKGIFIAVANFDNVGAMLYLNSIIHKIPIYTSQYGKVIIENLFNKRSMKNDKKFIEYNINIVKPLQEIKVGNSAILPFAILNSIPDALGFIFQTDDGAVIILDDFIIASDENEHYQNQIYEINKITNNQNLLLISSIGNITKPYGFTAPNHLAIDWIKKELKVEENRRNLICCYDHDLLTIIKIVKLAQQLQMPLTIHNSVLYNLMTKFINLNLFENKNIIIQPISKANAMEKCIILVAYNKKKLFSMINNICLNNDELIAIKPNDKFILAFTTINGFEAQEAHTIDFIAAADLSWSKLPKNLIEMKASSEDHKLLVSNLKPKYLIPTSGLYYEFIDYQKIISETQKDIHFLILENGQEIIIDKARYLKDKTKWIEIKEKYVGNFHDFKEINPSLLSERKLMSENGVAFVSIVLKKEANKFVTKNLLIESYGIDVDKEVFELEWKTLNDNIMKLVADGFANRNINLKELKNLIKKLTAKFYDKFLGKTPLVLVTIIDK